jgi:Putative zinc-finger
MRRTAIKRRERSHDDGYAMYTEVIRCALQPGVNCLQLDVLGRYADAALSPLEHAAALRHLDACVACRGEVALLRAFASGRVAEQERRAVRAIVRQLRRRERLLVEARSGPSGAARRSPLSGSSRIALALAVVLLAVGIGHQFSTSIPADFAARSSIGGGASRSLAVELVGPHGDQPAAPRRLEWRRLNGAVRYRAALIEVDRHEVWSIETSATAVDLPERVRALVLPAKTLVWHVTAYNAAGAPIGESPPDRFRLEQR